MSIPEVLPECSQGFQELRVSVAVIEKDIIQHAKVADKLSEAVEKIQEMNANLCKMIALHELRHESADKAFETFDDDLRDVHGRIDTMMAEKKPTKAKNADTDTDAELKKALADITKWKYIFTGAAIVIGYLLEHFKWSAFIALFGG